MIRAVVGHGGGEAAFLAAANAQPLPGVELASAWYALGKGQPRGANGWHFFTSGEDEEPFALALRRGTAWSCGRHDPEELGEFLRWAGVSRLTARLPGMDAPSFAACPDGFSVAERMLGFVRPYGGTERGSAGKIAGAGNVARPSAYGPGSGPAPHGMPDPFPAGYRLVEETDAGRMAEFLCGQGAFAALDSAADGTQAVAEQQVRQAAKQQAQQAVERQAQQAAARLFAQELDARAVIGLGYAAFLLGPDPVPRPSRIAGVMAVSTAPHTKAVCLSALQMRAEMRGQGLGGRMVQTLAAEAERYARGVCLLCRPERAGFYTRLGFVPEGEYACFVPTR